MTYWTLREWSSTGKRKGDDMNGNNKVSILKICFLDILIEMYDNPCISEEEIIKEIELIGDFFKKSKNFTPYKGG